MKCEAAVAILASEGLALVPSVTSKLEVRSFIPCLFDLLKVLNKVAGRVSDCAFVSRKCNWARWVYCTRERGGTPVSTSKAVWSP